MNNICMGIAFDNLYLMFRLILVQIEQYMQDLKQLGFALYF